MIDSKLVQKIQQLMAHAEGTNNEHEAAAFAAKAQELMLRHNLTEGDLTQGETPQAVRDELTLADTSGWVDQLFSGVATAHGCTIVIGRRWRQGTVGKNDRVITVFGRPTNVEIVKYLGTYLFREIRRLRGQAGGSNAYKNSYAMGAALAVVKRLREGLAEFQSTADSKALVVVMNAEALALRDATYPKLASGRSSSLSGNGWRAGAAAGQNIALNKGIAGSTNHAGQFLLGGR